VPFIVFVTKKFDTIGEAEDFADRMTTDEQTCSIEEEPSPQASDAGLNCSKDQQ